MQARPGTGKTRPGSRVRTQVTVVAGGERSRRSDYLATEEPMELRISLRGATTTLAVTMRTPGADFELAAGFLLGEGVVHSRENILGIRYCAGPVPGEQRYNVVTAELDPALDPDLRPLERHFTTTSACGVCGKASLEALQMGRARSLPPGPVVSAGVLFGLPDRMREAQGVFRSTGGLHAAALFDAEGCLLALREDVGRHNALDKLIGWALLQGRLPLHDCVVLVSGRASFELAQKAMAGGIPVLCAVSAPSSLAVDVAQAFGMTLVGFLRGQRCNVYTGAQRIAANDSPPAPTLGPQGLHGEGVTGPAPP